QGVLRKAALEVVEGKSTCVKISAKNLEKYAGQPKVQSEVAGRAPEIGVATGLAWTPVGGDIMFIEAIRMPGKGQITLTGQLGDVMKESAQAAWSLLRARAAALGIPLDVFTQSDVHLHVPAGDVPTEVPTAGITTPAALAEIRKRDGKYNERAYVFVLAALEFAQTRLPARRHLSGVELAWSCRDLALEQFGMLAAAVLAHWGVHGTQDFGQIVFMLIDVGLL